MYLEDCVTELSSVGSILSLTHICSYNYWIFWLKLFMNVQQFYDEVKTFYVSQSLDTSAVRSTNRQQLYSKCALFVICYSMLQIESKITDLYVLQMVFRDYSYSRSVFLYSLFNNLSKI